MNKETLKSYLADYYKDSKVVDNILNAYAIEISALEKARTEMIKQLQPETATYSLSRWENDYCLDNKDNYDITFRRNIIIARMKGSNTCTKEFIENVALSYGNGEVEVIEPTVIGDYTLIIKFIGKKGIPPNLDDFKNTIEEIIPAHLEIEYEFTYNVWNDVKAKTWGEIKTMTWQEIKEFNNRRA